MPWTWKTGAKLDSVAQTFAAAMRGAGGLLQILQEVAF